MAQLCAQDPQPVLATPDKLKELTSKLEQLQKQLTQEKPVAPSRCDITGQQTKIGDNQFALLQLKYQFRTTQPKQNVLLGLKKAFVTEAKWPEGLPPLQSTDAGLTVAVEKAGDHEITLTVEAPLQPRGLRNLELGFDLQLPGSPITVLKWNSAETIKRIRIGRRENSTEAIESKRYSSSSLASSGAGEALGPVVYLEVAWEEPTKPTPDKQRMARSTWDVQIRDTEIVTNVVFNLSGPAREWLIAAPTNSQLTVARAVGNTSLETSFDPPPGIFRPEPKEPPIWKVAFPEATNVDMSVTVSYTQTRGKNPNSRELVPLCAIGVLDLPLQTGTIKIQSIPTLRVKEILKGDTKRQPGSDDPSEISLRFSSMSSTNNLPQPLAELDIRPAVGVVQTRTSHSLYYSETGWRLKTDVTVQPIRKEIDKIELVVPVTTELENVLVTPPELVESVESVVSAEAVKNLNPSQRLISVNLAAPKRNPFTITLEGLYPIPLSEKSANLQLPRPYKTLDREGSLTANPSPGIEVSGTIREWDQDKAGTWTAPLESQGGGIMSAKLARTVGEVLLDWKPRLPRVSSISIVDLTLKEKSLRFDVESKVTFLETVPPRLRWKSRGGVTAIRTPGGSREVSAAGDFVLPISTTNTKEAVFRFSYEIPLPDPKSDESSQSLSLDSVPIFWLEAEGRTNTDVRFWYDSTSTIEWDLNTMQAENHLWEAAPYEIVPERENLPIKVLRSVAPGADLSFELVPRQGSGIQTRVWIDRIFAQSQMPDRQQRNRVRFLVRRWLTRTIDFQLPSDASDLEILLNGKSFEVTPPANDPNRVQIEMPAWKPDRSAVIEFRYNRPGRVLGLADWQLPIPLGRVSVGPCRWQIALPGRALPMAWSEAIFEESWSLRPGLPFPVAARGLQELERWFTSGEEPTEAAGWQLDEAGITARQNTLDDLQVLLLPRYGTLMILSGLAVVICYSILKAKMLIRWIISLLLIAGILTIYLWNGQWLPILLACALPGIIGFLLIFGYVQYHLMRYHRIRNKLPGFQSHITFVESAPSKNGSARNTTKSADKPLSSLGSNK
ncbi:hypothetical protein KIH39_17115 [Telmatocola sphagniphila]|uniref:Uncharacterized protein n=1 Tax=Telmatocola sphagniphila TaxID=1123043 RepID=A0A8E6ETU6_9BACT|nr:hypothetical protein [Telmatocola sphagniphila]QVL30565.1 hypothetical protein KIH39_17115 [Telmatocola sphagniphila]